VGLRISPDGQWIAANCPDRGELHPVNGGEPKPIRGLEPDDVILQWSADGRSLFVSQRSEYVARVFLLDLETGDRVLWKELAPDDRSGVAGKGYTIVVNPDGTAYAYSYNLILSELYVAEGLQ
jgi:Tol biopolymer transport system component